MLNWPKQYPNYGSDPYSQTTLSISNRILVMDLRVKRSAKRRSHSGALLINWWYLKGEKQRIFQHKILKEGFMQPQGSAKDMWEKMAHEIK